MLADIAPPNYRLLPYEQTLLHREIGSLAPDSSFSDDSGLRVSTSTPMELTKLAFAHGITVDGEFHPTRQALRELASAEEREAAGRRKNSLYGPHAIHRYKGKFYPQLAKALINASSSRSGLVLDPFGGSGTVLTEALLAGRPVASIDCNPVAVAAARAKAILLLSPWAATRASLLNVRLAVLRARPVPAVKSLHAFRPELHQELRSWFAPMVLRRLAALVTLIGALPDSDLRTVAQVLLSDSIREVSHQDPLDLRIRRRSEPLVDADVTGAFISRLDRLVRRMDLLQPGLGERPASPPAFVVLGNSMDPSLYKSAGIDEVACVVSSPPYGVALPYIDTDRLSLALVFGYDKAQRRDLESGMIGSRDITRTAEREWEERLLGGDRNDPLPSSVAGFLSSYRTAINDDPTAGFRKRQAPLVLARYFFAMKAFFTALKPVLRDGADIWMVLGDSKSQVGGATWNIPITEGVTALAEERGLSFQESLPISVSKERVHHSKNAITQNHILHFRRN